MTDDKAALLDDVEREVCDEIKRIMQTYREQEAERGYVDTPGGLEHMGDVWKLFSDWDDRLRAALSPRTEGDRLCTCHPDDNPPRPCPRKYALQDCRAAAAPAEQPRTEGWVMPTDDKLQAEEFVDSWYNATRGETEVIGVDLEELTRRVAIILSRIPAAPAAGAEQGWRDISTAPRDRPILVWAPGRDGLSSMTSLCRYHEDAGFCIDELREPTHWQPLPPPPSA